MQNNTNTHSFSYLKCFGITFAITFIVFSFYLVTFYTGNHDITYLKFGTKLTQGVWEGRLTQFAIQLLLFNGQLLPILSSLIGLIFFCLTPIILSKTWNLPKNTTNIILFSLLLTTNPFALSQLYYIHQITSILMWHLFCTLGLYFSLSTSPSKKHHLFNYFMAYILWFTSISGYAPSINTVFVLISATIIIEIITKDLSLKQIIAKFLPIIIIAFLSSLSYYTAIKILKHKEIIQNDMYNVQILGIKDIIQKIIQNYDMPIKMIFHQPPFNYSIINYILGIFLILFFITSKTKKRRYLLLFFFACMLYATCISSFLSTHDIFYTYRINFFSIPYILITIFATLSLSSNKFIKNVSFICSIILLSSFIKADTYIQKIWHLGNKQDEQIIEKTRTELLNKIDLNKKYRLYYIGELNGRQKFADTSLYKSNHYEIYREYYTYAYLISPFISSGLFLTEPYNPIYGAAFFYRGIGNLTLINNNEYLTKKERNNSIFYTKLKPEKKFNPQIYNWLTNQRKPNIMIKGNNIFIYFHFDYMQYASLMHYFGFYKKETTSKPK